MADGMDQCQCASCDIVQKLYKLLSTGEHWMKVYGISGLFCTIECVQLSQTVKVLKAKYKWCKEFSFFSFPVSLTLGKLVLISR